MTVLASDDFDSDTLGAIAPGWVAINGTWAVGTVDPISGARSFGETTATNGTVAVFTGIAARADGIVTFQEKIGTITESASYYVGFRGAADWSTGFMFGLEWSGSALQYASYTRSGGSYSAGTPSAASGFSVGDVLNFEVTMSGTSFEFRVWKVGNSRPSSPSLSFTSSSNPTGYAALYRANTSARALAIDNFIFTDGVVAVATAVTMTGPSSGVVSVASSAFTVALSPSGGTVTGTATCTPSDSSGGGTFTPTTVGLTTASPSATFTYTPGSTGAKTISLTNSAGLTNPSSVTYTSNAAATVPTAPTIGTATAGAAQATVAYTAPSSDGGSAITGYVATSTPGSITGSVSGPTATPIVVSGLTNGTAYTFTVHATNAIGNSAESSASNSVTPSSGSSATFAVSDPSIYFSPGNWYSDGSGSMQITNIHSSSTLAWSNMRGSYLKFRATVGASGAVGLTINTTTLSGLTPAGCPQIMWSINGGSLQSHTLVSGETALNLATGLSAGTYEIAVWFRGVYITMDGDVAQNYTTPNNRFQISAINLSTGGTISSTTIRPKIQLSFGDSITEGDLSNGGPRSATSQDATLVYPWFLAESLNAEVGVIGFYGQQWSWFNSSWPNYANGFSRLIGGLLSPAPDYITVNYGENDGNPGPAASTVTATLAAVAAAAPSAKIVLLIPFSGRALTNLSAATLPANGYRVNLARYEMQNGNTVWSYDGQHPNQRGHAYLAGLLSYAVQAAFAAGPTLTGRTVTITLANPAGAPQTGLTGLKWAFFDQVNPNSFATPTSQGAIESTDGSGVCVINVNTTLSSGGVGWLVITNSDGTVANRAAQSVFSGPVTVV